MASLAKQNDVPATATMGTPPRQLIIDAGSAVDWFSGLMALAAVVVALVLARKSDRDQLKREQSQRRGIALKTMAKLLVVVNEILNLQASMSGDPSHRLAQDGGHKWRYIGGISNLAAAGRFSFDADEFGLLVDGRDVRLAMDISLLHEKHISLVTAIAHYTQMRERLFLDFPAPSTIDGTQASVYVEGDLRRRLEIRAAALEAHLDAVLKHLGEAKALADSVRDRVGPAYRAILKDPTFPLLGIPPRRETA